MTNNKKLIFADVGIMFIAISWGLNFSVIKWSLSDITPMYYLSLRFLLSGALIGIIFVKTLKGISKEDIVCGAFSGILLAASFAAQVIGLQYTTPGKAGFLANASVIIIPLLVWIIYKKKPTGSVLVGGGIAFAGLAIISMTEDFTIQFGDALQIICAICFAGQTLVIDRYAERINPIRMAAFQVVVAGLISLAVAMMTESSPDLAQSSMPVIVGVSYGVIFCTALSFVIQGYAQRITPPSHVAIILCFEAVFALVFAISFGYEQLTFRSMVGSSMVLVGFIVSQINITFGRKKE